MTARTFSRSRPLWLWIALALILDIAGAQHVYAQPTIAAAALTALLLWWLAPAALARDDAADPALPPPARHDAPAPPGLLLIALLPAAALVAAMIDVATFIPPDSGWSPRRLALLLGGSGALVVLALRRAPAGVIALVALLLGTAIRLIHLRQVPIAPPNGDMLPLVMGALDNLSAGRSPYMTYQMPWPVPLTYLPVTWLSYAPAYLLGIDLRWTNVAAEVIIGGGLAWLAAQSRGWQRTWRDEPALLLWAWLFLQPSVIHWDAGNTAPITWALLALTVVLVLAGRDLAGAAALGLLAAGSPLAAVFGPFIGIHWLRQRGLLPTVRLLLIAGIVAAALVLPFLVWSPADFVGGTYRWFNQIDGWPRQKWLETDPPIWSVITGWSGEFWARGAERWLKPIQALIVAGVALRYWLRGARAAELSTHAAAAYLGFMLFNPVLWPYLYNPALVVGLVGLVPLAATRATNPIAVSAAERRSQPTFS